MRAGRQMMGRRSAILAATGTALLGFAPAAAAQEISKGLNLVGLTLSFDHKSTTYENSTIPGSRKYPDSFSAEASLGLDLQRLITDRLGVGIGFAYQRARHSGRLQTESGALVPYRSVTWAGMMSASGTYFVKPGRGGSSYATARAGAYLGESFNPVSLGVGVGYLALLGAAQRGAALSAEVAFTHYSYTGGSSNTISLGAGFTFYFGGRRQPPPDAAPGGWPGEQAGRSRTGTARGTNR
jgi:hypothetical protein